jgi:hypothetical protein
VNPLEQQLLGTPEVAEMLHCNVKVVEMRARSGELPGLQFGRGWVFPAEALYQRLNEIALERARERNKPVPPPRPSAVLKPVPTKKRPLPELPELPDPSKVA